MRMITKKQGYDVITTTVYIKNDIPVLKLSDGKLWFKEKTYKSFAKNSCGLNNREYQEIIKICSHAIAVTKKEVEIYNSNSIEVSTFLKLLKETWREKI